jgi:hypothetical protein
MMRTVGRITTGLGLFALAAGIVLVVRSIPDLKRYARIRAL